MLFPWRKSRWNRQMFWTLWSCTDYDGESWCGWSQGEYFDLKKVRTLSSKERKLWRGHQYPYESKRNRWDRTRGGSQMESYDWKSVGSSIWMHWKRRRSERNYEERTWHERTTKPANRSAIEQKGDQWIPWSSSRAQPCSYETVLA